MGVEADGLVVVLWPAGSGVVGVGMIRVQTNDLVVVRMNCAYWPLTHTVDPAMVKAMDRSIT